MMSIFRKAAANNKDTMPGADKGAAVPGADQGKAGAAVGTASTTTNPECRFPAAFWLVVIMLGILLVLIVFLLGFPQIHSSNKDLMEYYKWALSVLLGAFGAWIGAGAAYFFGKENLQESSRSTESAMRIQQESFGRPPLTEKIKDMTLTAMNSGFIFYVETKVKDVRERLNLAQFKGYWFVPVLEEGTGRLKDIIHARVFWGPDLPSLTPDSKIKDWVSKMDEDKELTKLHGSSFYVTVSPDHKISEVYNEMCKNDAEVAIVVDESEKPSHCLSKTDLRTVLNVK